MKSVVMPYLKTLFSIFASLLQWAILGTILYGGWHYFFREDEYFTRTKLVYFTNQTAENAFLVVASRETRDDPLIVEGRYTLAPGKLLSLPSSNEMWVYFETESPSTIYKTSSVNTWNFEKAAHELRLAYTESKLICVVEGRMVDMTISELCDHPGSKSVQSFRLYNDDEVFLNSYNSR